MRSGDARAPGSKRTDAEAVPGPADVCGAGAFDPLNRVDAVTLGDYLRNERPQTGALILAHLDHEQVRRVLVTLPPSFAAHVLVCMFHLGPVAANVLDDVAAVMTHSFQWARGVAPAPSAADFAASLLATVDAPAEGIDRARIERVEAALCALLPPAPPPVAPAPRQTAPTPPTPSGPCERGMDEIMASIRRIIGDNGDEVPADGGRVASGARIPLPEDEVRQRLGLGSDRSNAALGTGLGQIVNSSQANLERLPMLEKVFERALPLMTRAFNNFVGEHAEFTIENISSVRFGDYLNGIPLPALLAVFRAVEWHGNGLLVADHTLTSLVIDRRQGGSAQTGLVMVYGQPYTEIERRLLLPLAQTLIEAVAAAFHPLSPVTLRVDRLETNPRFACIAGPAAPAVVLGLRVAMSEGYGRLSLALPYATLVPIQPLLLQMFPGEFSRRDRYWEHRISVSLMAVGVPVSVTFAAPNALALADLRAVTPGTVLALGWGNRLRATLTAPGQTIARVALEEIDGHLVARIEHPVIETTAPDQAATPGVVIPPPRWRTVSMTEQTDPPTLALPAGETPRLDGVAAVGIRLRVSVGETILTVADLLKLGRGAVIELNKKIGEPFDIYANDTLIARGEIVCVEDRIGVMFTEVIGHER